MPVAPLHSTINLLSHTGRTFKIISVGASRFCAPDGVWKEFRIMVKCEPFLKRCSLRGAQPYLGRTLSGQPEIVRRCVVACAEDKLMLAWYVVRRSIMDSWTNVSRTEFRKQLFDESVISHVEWVRLDAIDCATLIDFEYLAEGAPWTVEPTLGGQNAMVRCWWLSPSTC